ncbi:AtzG-like protein [Sphingomonas sp.]|uniref:AtzG-like protein n=1 Tax=Sphingomonas sp. TaxID=28214 RepID=UPI000DB22B5C|nr:AtzG-like protein [Sphingomonas sp.]PZU11697.1 MAG: hypothetical protein DI605_01575 [Sphingomonas sp.]
MNEEEREAREAAARIGIDLPDQCVPGVVENLRLLAHHAALLNAAPEETHAA